TCPPRPSPSGPPGRAPRAPRAPASGAARPTDSPTWASRAAPGRWSSRNFIEISARSNYLRRRFVMPRACFALILPCLVILRSRAHAQMPSHQPVAASGGVSVIPIFTWAQPSAGDRAFTEAYLTQPVAMGTASYHALSAVGTLDLEGLTL